jgi:hypothetical protein
MARRFEKDAVKRVNSDEVSFKLRKEPNDYESNRKQRRLKLAKIRRQVLALKRGDALKIAVGNER